MNQQERDQLRARHISIGADDSSWPWSHCEECSGFDGEVEWPCDTAKVLDAWEAAPMREKS